MKFNPVKAGFFGPPSPLGKLIHHHVYFALSHGFTLNTMEGVDFIGGA